jgi:hypothetical protein
MTCAGAVKFNFSDRRLRRWFSTYNGRHFGGALDPATRLKFHHEPGYWGWVLNDAGESCTIHMNHECTPDSRVGRIYLFHEMVHLQLDPYAGHGPRFQRRMQELAAAGAFKGLW